MTESRGKRTVAIIPARYGSRRLPGKPLVEIAGKPMIQHVYERTSRATLVDLVLVATDDERIASAVRLFGGRAVLTPEDLASGTDRIAYAARGLYDTELVVNVQGDEPLVEPAMIDDAVRMMQQDPTLPAGTVVRKITSEEELFDPNIPKVALGLDGRCLYFSRSVIPFVRDTAEADWLNDQEFHRHIGLYVFRRDFLLRFAEMPPSPLEQAERLEQLRILENGYRIRAIVTEYDTVPVDTEADLQRARASMRRMA